MTDVDALPAEPPYSCPEFDAVKESLQKAQQEVEYLNQHIENIVAALENCDSHIEVARSINDTLRKRAEGFEEAWGEVRDELETMQSDLDSKCDELSDLESQIEDLQQQIKDIQQE